MGPPFSPGYCVHDNCGSGSGAPGLEVDVDVDVDVAVAVDLSLCFVSGAPAAFNGFSEFKQVA